ncbi:MAG TPA: GrpB family protein [Blastocatellia bacterium]|nr:GrpB family protein [Blastocatellia bacterium]
MPGANEPTILLYKEAPAECRDYDPRAAEVAATVAKMITARLPDVTVEHIGSTAIPGCAGKGVVDLMILYASGQLERVKVLLDELGFQRQSTRDPWPEERPMRLGAIAFDNKIFRLHTHIIHKGAEEVRELRRFRDLLRSDDNLRAAYISRKRGIIASGVTDSVDYSMAKDSFIKSILNQR